MKSSKLSRFLLKAIPTLVCLLFLIPLVTLAQESTPETLVKFPGINAGDTNFGNYVNALYKLSITVASLLAVIKLIGAGAKYVMSDMVSSKESAKADIKNAIIGLLIILAAVTILTEINPKLNNFGIVGQAVDVSGSYKNPTTATPVCQTANPSATCNEQLCDGTWSNKTEGGLYSCIGTIKNPVLDEITKDKDGEIINLVSGNTQAQIDKAIENQESKNGKVLLGDLSPALPQTSIENEIQNCKSGGGNYYQVFKSAAGDTFKLACYK